MEKRDIIEVRLPLGYRVVSGDNHVVGEVDAKDVRRIIAEQLQKHEDLCHKDKQPEQEQGKQPYDDLRKAAIAVVAHLGYATCLCDSCLARTREVIADLKHALGSGEEYKG